ncbi:MAG: SDR family oxidoreductase [Chloroflexi bacterium]|nr:SDR family oxidoreductase [Chloroflexota bacterium]
MQLENKVAIVTGASSGIGVAIARELNAHGIHLMITARREDKLNALRDELTESGVDVAVCPGDVTVEADCQNIVNITVEIFGTIDILINNAGYGPPASLLDTDETLWDATIDSCLKSVYLMTRAALPTMLAKNSGTIVQISSVAGKYGFNNRTAYCAAKWGVQGFTEALRTELGSNGIHVFTVNPAAVATPWWAMGNDPQPPEIMERMLQPEDIAGAVRWGLTQPDHIQLNEIELKTYRSPWAR